LDTVGSGGRRAGSGGGVWCKVLWDKEEGQSGKYLVGWTGMFDLCIVEEVLVAIIITTSAMIFFRDRLVVHDRAAPQKEQHGIKLPRIRLHI